MEQMRWKLKMGPIYLKAINDRADELQTMYDEDGIYVSYPLGGLPIPRAATIKAWLTEQYAKRGIPGTPKGN